MKKILLITSLTVIAAHSFAYFNYRPFQQFDNQVSLGFNAAQGDFNTRDTANHPNSYGTSSLNVEVEKLFDIGLWLDGNVGIQQTYTQTIGPVAPLGAVPYLINFNIKAGYSIPFTNYFALVPYVVLGKNANVTSLTAIVGGFADNVGIDNDFFYTYGGGVRLDFPINKYVDLYLDEMLAVNDDQTNYKFDNDFCATCKVSASNLQNTTTLGAKLNVVSKLQLAANVFYTTYGNYDSQSVNIISSPNDGNGGVPTTAFGAQISVGFTFQ